MQAIQEECGEEGDVPDLLDAQSSGVFFAGGVQGLLVVTHLKTLQAWIGFPNLQDLSMGHSSGVPNKCKKEPKHGW